MVDKCDIFLNLSTSRSVSNSPGLLLLGTGSWGADAELGIVLILASLQTQHIKKEKERKRGDKSLPVDQFEVGINIGLRPNRIFRHYRSDAAERIFTRSAGCIHQSQINSTAAFRGTTTLRIWIRWTSIRGRTGKEKQKKTQLFKMLKSGENSLHSCHM